MSAQPNVYVANVAGNNVTVVSTASLSVTAFIPVSLGPTGLAVTPNGASVYVACQSANVVSVISTSSNSVIANIPVGGTPTQLAISPNGARVFVADSASNQVSIIDTNSNSVIATVGVGQKPSGVAFSPDSSRAFVVNNISNNVSIIDTASNSVIGTFSVPGGPAAVVVTPNGQRVYVANQATASVSVHDLSGNLLTTVNGLAFPDSLAVTPNSARVFVGNGNSASASIIDTGSNSIIANTGVGSLPTAVAISSDGSRAFVANEFGFSLSVIDVASGGLVGTIDRVGVYPVGVATTPAAVSQSQGVTSCTYSISPGSASYGSGGGSGAVTVTAPSGCAWSANSNSGLLTITSGSSGSGSGIVYYSSSANSSTAAVSGSLTIAGQSFTVSEAGIACSYSLSAYANVMTYLGGVGSVVATAPAGCPWSVSSDSSWLSVTSALSASGTGVITFLTAGNLGAARSGNLNVGGMLYNVTQAGVTAAGPPTADSVTPNSGTGASQNFAFRFSSTGGYANIDVVYVVLNNSLNTLNGCFMTYQPATHLVTLFNDSGSAGIGAFTPGSSGTAQNGHCSIDAAGSSLAGSGNTLTLTLAVRFNSSVVATQNLYGFSHDTANQSSGWQTLGSWTPGAVVSGPPTTDSVTPNSGSGGAQSFTFRYSSGSGASSLQVVYGLINASFSASSGCFVYYLPSSNGLYLVNDAGSGIVGGFNLGSGGSLQNSRCTISAAGSTAVLSGNTLALTVAVTFSGATVGTQSMYGFAYDSASQGSGWQTLGAWTPRAAVAAPPTVDSATPNAGAGSAQNFTFRYSSPNGASYIDLVYALVNGGLSGSLGCFVYYIPSNNTLYLVNDAGTGIVGGIPLGGAGALQNTRCTVTAAGSSAVASGNTLALTVAMTFNAPWTGTQTLFGYAHDSSAQVSNWQTLGTWRTP